MIEFPEKIRHFVWNTHENIVIENLVVIAV